MMEFKLHKIGKWDSLVYKDIDNLTGETTFIITYAKKGGAIISSKNYAEAKRKFIEAMAVAEAVQKLYFFVENGIFPKTYLNKNRCS